MNIVERYPATFRHEPTDRAPIALSFFGAGFGRKHLGATDVDRIKATKQGGRPGIPTFEAVLAFLDQRGIIMPQPA